MGGCIGYTDCVVCGSPFWYTVGVFDGEILPDSGTSRWSPHYFIDFHGTANMPCLSDTPPHPHNPLISKLQLQLSKKTPSLGQIRAILEACVYRGKGEEADADRVLLEKCTLAGLQVRRIISYIFGHKKCGWLVGCT